MLPYDNATSRGWKVFPLKPNSKTPAVKDWESWATTTPDPIWWSTDGQGFGVACGPSNLYVIDIDHNEHANGYRSWLELLDRHGPLPATYSVCTPRGGLHLYYHTETPPPNTASRIGPGIDTRGSGGYVVGYPPADNIETQPLPDWLHPPTTQPTAKPTYRPRNTNGGTSRYGQQALTLETEKIRTAPQGTRNHQLNTSAYRIAQLVQGGEIDSRHAVEQLIYAGLAAGLTETETLATTSSAFTAQNLTPRSAR